MPGGEADQEPACQDGGDGLAPQGSEGDKPVRQPSVFAGQQHLFQLPTDTLAGRTGSPGSQVREYRGTSHEHPEADTADMGAGITSQPFDPQKRRAGRASDTQKHAQLSGERENASASGPTVSPPAN